MTWQATCYGEPVAKFNSIDEAKTGWEKHIRETCPHGSMEWATDIKWRSTGFGYAAAASGEWLDHRVEKEGGK